MPQHIFIPTSDVYDHEDDAVMIHEGQYRKNLKKTNSKTARGARQCEFQYNVIFS